MVPVVIDTAGVTEVLTVIVIGVEVTVVVPAHALDDVNWQVTISLLFKVVELYEAVLVPTLLPLTFH